MVELFFSFCLGVFLLLGAWYAPRTLISILLFAADLYFLGIIVLFMSIFTEISITFDKKDLDKLK